MCAQTLEAPRYDRKSLGGMARIDVVCASPPTLVRVTLPNGEEYTYKKVCVCVRACVLSVRVQVTTCVLRPMNADRYITNAGTLEISCEKTQCVCNVELIFSEERNQHEAHGTVRLLDKTTAQMQVSARARVMVTCTRAQPVRWLHGSWSTRMCVSSTSTLADSRVLYETVPVPEFNITNCYGFR